MALEVVAVVPRRRKSGRAPGPAAATGKPDLDNILKITMDALAEFWVDDAQVVEIHAYKTEHAPGERPRLSLRVRPAGTGEP